MIRIVVIIKSTKRPDSRSFEEESCYKGGGAAAHVMMNE